MGTTTPSVRCTNGHESSCNPHESPCRSHEKPMRSIKSPRPGLNIPMGIPWEFAFEGDLRPPTGRLAPRAPRPRRAPRCRPPRTRHAFAPQCASLNERFEPADAHCRFETPTARPRQGQADAPGNAPRCRVARSPPRGGHARTHAGAGPRCHRPRGTARLRDRRRCADAAADPRRRYGNRARPWERGYA